MADLATTTTTPSPALPEAVTRRGISEAQWRTLCNNLFPGANPQSVLMVWDYCLARQLDPMKKPCHIVPMEVKDAKTGKRAWRDVVMPGIYEYRTTAQRTGDYLGHSPPAYGDPIDVQGVTAPEWCDITVYRWNAKAKQQVEFPVRTFFREVVATTREGKPNARWAKAPIQMLSKCCEAAALREGFPDELGGEPTYEEMVGQPVVLNDTGGALPARQTHLEKPEGYDSWLDDLTAVADEGAAALTDAWQQSALTHRQYLTATQPEVWDALKRRATAPSETTPTALSESPAPSDPPPDLVDTLESPV